MSSTPERRPVDPAEHPLSRKLLWFAGLWVAGVLTVGAVAYGLRLILF